MASITEFDIVHPARKAMFVVLAVATAFVGLLLVGRLYMDQVPLDIIRARYVATYRGATFLFLAWNLFLAWIP